MLISFVILTWNSVKYINSCVSSYATSMAAANLQAEFLIVDNGSSDGTCEEIERNIFPRMSSCCKGNLLRLQRNFGTTVSRNMALRMARGQMIVICDSDTEYKAGSWKAAIEYVEENNSVGILAPMLCLEDRTIQHSVKKFPMALDKFNRVVEILLHKKIVKSDLYEDFPWTTPRPVDTAISACWVFRRDHLDTVGYLDEAIFYSPEDIDYCLRTWKCQKEVIFYPKLKIIHHTQQISHKRPFSRHALSHAMGLIYYFVKHKCFFSRDALKKRLEGHSRALEKP